MPELEEARAPRTQQHTSTPRLWPPLPQVEPVAARVCTRRPSEGLADAEEEVHTPERDCPRFAADRERWWIQVKTHVQPHRPDRRFIAQSAANRVRQVIETARGSRTHQFATCAVRLSDTEEAVKQVGAGGENISHVVKQDRADAVAKEWQRHRWKAQLNVVDE